MIPLLTAISICQASLDLTWINPKQVVSLSEPYINSNCNVDPKIYCDVLLSTGSRIFVFTTCKNLNKTLDK
jgi:hypothetical protein